MEIIRQRSPGALTPIRAIPAHYLLFALENHIPHLRLHAAVKQTIPLGISAHERDCTPPFALRRSAVHDGQ